MFLYDFMINDMTNNIIYQKAYAYAWIIEWEFFPFSFIPQIYAFRLKTIKFAFILIPGSKSWYVMLFASEFSPSITKIQIQHQSFTNETTNQVR